MRALRAFVLRPARFAAFAAPWTLAVVDGGHLSALPERAGPRGARTAEQAAIERQPICIGSSVASAGKLSDVLYYRATDTGDKHVTVGYFVFFSEERPWGNNWLTWTVAPALAVDLFYSRTLLVAPGIQRAIYGAGDVEGVAVRYRVLADGSLDLEGARAEDRHEETVPVSREDAFALDRQRPTFYSDVWSHQLAGRGARTLADLAYVHCYQGDAVRPLPDSVARAFRLENRAGPAHVERIAGRKVDEEEASPVERAQAINGPGLPPG